MTPSYLFAAHTVVFTHNYGKNFMVFYCTMISQHLCIANLSLYYHFNIENHLFLIKTTAAELTIVKTQCRKMEDGN